MILVPASAKTLCDTIRNSIGEPPEEPAKFIQWFAALLIVTGRNQRHPRAVPDAAVANIISCILPPATPINSATTTSIPPLPSAERVQLLLDWRKGKRAVGVAGLAQIFAPVSGQLPSRREKDIVYVMGISGDREEIVRHLTEAMERPTCTKWIKVARDTFAACKDKTIVRYYIGQSTKDLLGRYAAKDLDLIDHISMTLYAVFGPGTSLSSSSSVSFFATPIVACKGIVTLSTGAHLRHDIEWALITFLRSSRPENVLNYLGGECRGVSPECMILRPFSVDVEPDNDQQGRCSATSTMESLRGVPTSQHVRAR